jgi:hypothetical protein
MWIWWLLGLTAFAAFLAIAYAVGATLFEWITLD